MSNVNGPSGGRGRRSLSSKGKALKLNQSFGDRLRSKKLSRQTAKATYLSTLPKDRWKRLAYRLHPKRVAAYWFSREGAIMALKIVGVGIVACFFLTIGLFAYFRKDLPKLRDISGQKIGGSITYYDRTGQTVLWQDYDAVKRIPVTNDNISSYMKEATVAIEDKDFYKHGAFDVRGIMRAAIHDFVGGGGAVQGGSTITQQLVKLNEQWTNNRTITRKVKELILAVELEREYSKGDILTGYLNVAPYGGVEYGVESASRDYFGISAKDLNLAQASMLAAIPQSPSYYSPYGSPQFNPSASGTFNQTALLNRQHYILDQMVKQHYITQDQANQAKQENIMAEIKPLSSKYNGIKAPYFVLAAKKQLEQKYGQDTIQRGGWKVITTLDMDLQNKAEQLVASNLRNVESFGGDTEAMVAEDIKTGQIVSLVGGTDFSNQDHGKVNYASSVLIPPGSSFKPYDYSTLINNSNAGAGSVLYDSQGPIVDQTTKAGYYCTNKNRPKDDKNANCLWDYDFNYPGPVTLRYGLAGSRNVPAVKAMIQAGVGKTISTASAMMDNPYLQSKHMNTYNCYKSGTDLMQATSKDVAPCYPSSAIGDGAFLHLDDHVNGLATLGRMGVAIPRTYILKITDSAGKTVDQFSQPKGSQVIKPDTAYIMNNMLSDPNASYLRPDRKFQHQKNGWNFAVKTGTTNDNYDGLMTSWSTQYAVVSWVGYHTRTKAMTAGHMEQMTEPLTQGFMEYAHRNLKPDNWVQPSDIKVLPAYVVRAHVGGSSVEPSPATDLYPSWYTPKGGNSAQAIDIVSGKLATSCTPGDAKQTQGNSNVNAFSIDTFVNGGNVNANTNATDDVHNCGDSPPSIHINTTACDTTCSLSATPFAGTHPLNDPNYPNFPGKVTISVNGNVVCTSTNISDGQPVSCDYSPSFSGSGTVTATVWDSVLYSGSDQATINFTQAPAQGQNQGQGNQNLSITSVVASSNTYTVHWSGGTGAVGIYKGNTLLCTSTANGTCSYNKNQTPSGTQIYAKDSTNNQSSPFTIP